MKVLLQSILASLRRSRMPILFVGLTYLISVLVGVMMVHARITLALQRRDALVGAAQVSHTIRAFDRGFPMRAAVADFSGNLFLGAVPSTVMGISVIMPFPFISYRGWIGGIVSVDGEHKSRLTGREGIYYITILFLQLIPYTLSGGAGVRLGLGFLFPHGKWGHEDSKRWIGLPVEGLRDIGRVYLLVIPLFLLASLVEFLAR
jgi:hypothetical protein